MSNTSITVHLWCAPRSLSTCLMYSFSRRPDTKVYDEPLYANYLANNPHLFRPYRDELLTSSCSDSNAVMNALHADHSATHSIVFAKHIAKFLPYVEKKHLYVPNSRHVIMIRDPLKQINSWNVKKDIHHESYSLQTSGLLHLLQLYTDVEHFGAAPPIVIDSDELLEDPERSLRALCSALSIPFYEEQLSWPAGPKPDIDGLWAPHWYDEVHKSTGFKPKNGKSSGKYTIMSQQDRTAYEESLMLYQILKRKVLRGSLWNPGSSGFFPSSEAKRQVADDPTELTDPANAHVLVWVGQSLLPRSMAKVSVFDSAVQGGDAVWEGLRVYDGRVFKLKEHLDRLFDSAKALMFENIPSREFVTEAIVKTLAANGFRDHVHIRLTLTRGPKVSSSMNPRFNVFGCNLIVLAEIKRLGSATTYDNAQGICLVTSSQRRNGPQFLDSKIHHCNLLNNILAKIQGNHAQAHDALMLDQDGYVSETNATNVFVVKGREVWTPHADSCLPGVTRATVIQLARDLGIACAEKRVSLVECYTADAMFTTGTMGELTPVTALDGRVIPSGDNPILRRLQEAYRRLTEREGEPLPPFEEA